MEAKNSSETSVFSELDGIWIQNVKLNIRTIMYFYKLIYKCLDKLEDWKKK
jgi:hypothetical protein